MTRQPVRSSALRARVGAGALMAALAVTVLAAGGLVPADSDDDSGSDDSHTLHNTRCDPGYPEGVCVQSPTQSENNTTSEG